jgi:hypothetical protein
VTRVEDKLCHEWDGTHVTHRREEKVCDVIGREIWYDQRGAQVNRWVQEPHVTNEWRRGLVGQMGLCVQHE